MAIGDILSLTIPNSVTDFHGRVIPMRGAVAAVEIEGMGARHPIDDPFLDGSTLAIDLLCPGFVNGVLTTVPVRVNGTIAFRNGYPPDWNTLGPTIPPRSYCSGGSNGNRMYFTENGGTKGATRPTGTTNLGTFNDGGVTWVDLDPTLIASGQTQNAGYVNPVAGGNVTAYVVLDGYIFASDVIVGASVGGGMYISSRDPSGALIALASSKAKASIPCTNNSTLQYGMPVVKPISMPHQASQGVFPFELHVTSPFFRNGRQVDCVKMQAHLWDGSASGAQINAVHNLKSNVSPQTAPANVCLEVVRGDVPTPATPGEAYIEYEVYPFRGDRPFKSKLHGEARDFASGTTYSGLREVVRSGAYNYYLTTAGPGAATVAPTHTSGAVTGADGYGWTVFGSAALTGQVGTKQLSSNPQARFHIFNDLGTMRRGFCCVNPTGANIGSPVVYDTEAAALASKGTASFGSAALGFAALRIYHNTAGGGLTTHDDAGGGTAIALAGTHSAFGSTMATLPIGSEWGVFKADPTAAAGSVVFGYINSTARSAFRRIRVEGFSGVGGSGSLISSNEPVTTIGPPNVELWLEGWNYAGAAAANTLQVASGLTWFRNSTVTGGITLETENGRSHVVDAIGSKFSGSCLLRMADLLAFRVPAGGSTTLGDIGRTYLPGRMFMSNGRWRFAGAPTGVITMANLLTNNNIMPYLGTGFETCITESLSLSNAPALRIGADASDVDLSNVTVQYIAVVGERLNIGYNDNAANPLRELWFLLNNVSHSRSCVTDYTAHPISSSPRGASRFNNYHVVYAVGFRDNVIFTGNGSSGTNPATAMQRFGIRDNWGNRLSDVSILGEYVADRSRDAGSGLNVGDGDYHPAPGALALGKATVSGWKYDLDGTLRLLNGSGAVGPLERLDIVAANDSTLLLMGVG